MICTTDWPSSLSPAVLDICGRKMQVIVTGRRSTYWWCRETRHLSSSCPERKASRFPAACDQYSPLADSSSALPVMGPPATQTGDDNASVGSRPTFPAKQTPSSSADKEKEKGEWRVVGRCRGKSRTARPQSQYDPKGNDTYSPIPLLRSKDDAQASYEKQLQTY